MDPCSSNSTNDSFPRFPQQKSLFTNRDNKTSKAYYFLNKINKNLNKVPKDKFQAKALNEDKELNECDNEYFGSSASTSVTSSNNNFVDKPDEFFPLASSCKRLIKSSAELNSQTNNVQLKDCKSSLDTLPQNNLSKVSPFDLFEKIKEVYKACSYRVCECIVGKQLQNDCRCVPCVCDKCSNLKRKFTIANTFTSIGFTHTASDFSTLGTDLFKEFVKQELEANCNCKPCDCADCIRSAVAPCASRKYSCVDSDDSCSQNKYQRLAVAIVDDENKRHQNCTCTSCKCADCKNYYRDTSNEPGHESYMQINRPLDCHYEFTFNKDRIRYNTKTSNENCRRAMLKPTQNNVEYDFQRRLTSQKHKDKDQLDLIAMVADIRNKSKFSYDNKCCKCRPCECIDCDLKMKTSDIRDQTPCTCRECINKEEIIYPIKKGERLIPDMFENVNPSLIYGKTQSDDDYETPQKKARPSFSGEYYKSNLPRNNKAKEFLEHSRVEFSNIDQQLSHKLNTKLKRTNNIDSGLDISKASSSNEKISISSFTDESSMVNDKNDNKNSIYNNTKTINKYNSFEYSDNYLILKNRPTYLNDSNFNPLSQTKGNLKNCLNTHNFHNMFSQSSTSYKLKEKVKMPVLCEDSESNSNVKKYYVRLVDQSSQCNIIGKKYLIDEVSVPKNATCHTSLIKKIKKLKADGNEFIRETDSYSKVIEKPCTEINKAGSIDLETLPICTTRNNLSIDEDYRRVQKTIKDARLFSLHLKKLLDSYEKANREFENEYHHLSNSNKNVFGVTNLSQNGLIGIKETLKSPHYNEFADSKKSSDSLPTKEPIANTSFFDNTNFKIQDDSDSQYIFDDKYKISEPTNDKTLIRNDETNVTFLRHPSQQIVKECLEDIYDKVEPFKTNQKKLSIVSDFHSSGNRSLTTELKDMCTNNFCFDNLGNLTDNSNKYDEKLFSLKESYTSSNGQLQNSVKPCNTKKRSKRYTKMYKQVIVSNRRKLFVPTYAKRSMTTETETSSHTLDHKNDINNIEVSVIEVGTGLTVPTKIYNSGTAANVNRFKNDDNLYSNVDNASEIKRNKDEIIMIKPPLDAKCASVREIIDGTASGKFAIVEHCQKEEQLQNEEKENKLVTDNLGQAVKIWDSNAKTYPSISFYDRLDNETLVQSSDSLKVDLLTVRKVSDRTILVKWQVPKVLDNIEGYELLVNGRDVQIIDDNLCCESVVSSLPRREKILLTVRTVTKIPTTTSSTATVTVIYRPNHPQ